MLAIYPGGGSRFQAHVDNTTGDGRRLTVLCYLNPGWLADDGGALRVHADAGPVDVLPAAGRLALFYADKMKHEVRPTQRARAAVTLWYRRRAGETKPSLAASRTRGRRPRDDPRPAAPRRDPTPPTDSLTDERR